MATPVTGGRSYGRSANHRSVSSQAYWATPKPKKMSASARASRLSNRSFLGLHRHRAGSCSYAQVQDVLEANNEDYSFIAVMKKTHQRPDGTYVDGCARLVAETYEKHVEERLGQLKSSGGDNVTLENIDQRENNEIYVKTAGMSSCDVSSNDPEASEEVEKITQRLQEVEAELKSLEENLQFQKRLENMETVVQSITNLNV